MEKRWSERRRFRVGVDIYRGEELLGSVHSRDIGLGGTYLDAAPLDRVPLGTDLDLVFQLQDEGKGTRHRLSARLTRLGADGAGFKFCNFDTGVFRSLQEIMAYQKGRDPAAS